jgi:hypothetical protein
MEDNMKILIVLALMLTACAKETTQVTVTVPADPAYNVVTVSATPTLEECPFGGKRVDIYIDEDVSGDLSEGDLSVSSVIVCNDAPESKEDREKKCHKDHDRD